MQNVKQKLISVLVLSILLLGSLPNLAQDDDAQNIALTPMPIEEALVGVDGEMLIMEVVGTRSTGCEFPIRIEQRLIEGILYVDILEEVDISVMCPMMLIPYEEIIPLDITLDELPSEILVNGVTASISPLIGIAQSIDQEPPPGVAYHTIDSLTVSIELTEDDEEIVTLVVEGTQNDLCEFEVLNELDYADGWFTLEIYRDIPANVRCLGGTIPYRETFTYTSEDGLGLENEQYIAFEVNDFLAVATYNIPTESESVIALEVLPAVAVNSTVETVTPTLLDDAFGMNITGYYASGCEFPSRVRQELDEGIRVLYVTVYEAVLEGVAYPAMLRNFDLVVPLEGDYGDGTYTYNVNEVIGEFSIFNGALVATGRTIDHVINSVEVAIAESFPPQLILTMTGYQPDGCETLVQVDTTIDTENSIIRVHVYRTLPPGVMCMAVIVDYQDTVNIGAVQPGTYTLIVNNFETEIEVQ